MVVYYISFLLSFTYVFLWFSVQCGRSTSTQPTQIICSHARRTVHCCTGRLPHSQTCPPSYKASLFSLLLSLVSKEITNKVLPRNSILLQKEMQCKSQILPFCADNVHQLCNVSIIGASEKEAGVLLWLSGGLILS